MNANQRQSILDAIVEFEKTDFETPFKDKYKDSKKVLETISYYQESNKNVYLKK